MALGSVVVVLPHELRRKRPVVVLLDLRRLQLLHPPDLDEESREVVAHLPEYLLLHTVPEFPVAGVSPELVDGLEVGGRDVLHFREEDVAALHGGVAGEGDEEAAGLLIGLPEVGCGEVAPEDVGGGRGRRSRGGGGGGGGGAISGGASALAGGPGAGVGGGAGGVGGNIAVDYANIGINIGASSTVQAGKWVYNPTTTTWSYEVGTLVPNNVNGYAAGSWIVANGSTGTPGYYKFDAAGNMLTGWQQETSGLYYNIQNTADPNYGAMARGWHNIGGVDYYFDQDGRLMTNGTTPDGFTVNEFGMKVGVVGQVQASTGTQGAVATKVMDPNMMVQIVITSNQLVSAFNQTALLK